VVVAHFSEFLTGMAVSKENQIFCVFASLLNIFRPGSGSVCEEALC
jgi:hypothetical protein